MNLSGHNKHMTKKIPITAINGVEFSSSDLVNIVQVRVVDRNGLSKLSWDRFVRLQATANCVVQPENQTAAKLLDVGGYDGALALFLAGYNVELLDPETTGGTAMAIAALDQAYEVVTAVDVLEHIAPEERSSALKECARITSKQLVLNYPCQESAAAQELMLKLTGNSLIKQHVEWPLPDTDWVVKTLEELDFQVEVIKHTSVAIWLGQYLVQNLLPEVSAELNKFLIEKHSAEPFNVPLYHLVSAIRVGAQR